MSFNPLMTLLTAAVVPELEKAPTVIELGNQRFRPGNAAMAALLERTAGSPQIDHDELRRLCGLSKQERLPLTQHFYETLGFSDYQAIDVNEKYGSRTWSRTTASARDSRSSRTTEPANTSSTSTWSSRTFTRCANRAAG
jgi:hypothetical protein